MDKDKALNYSSSNMQEKHPGGKGSGISARKTRRRMERERKEREETHAMDKPKPLEVVSDGDLSEVKKDPVWKTWLKQKDYLADERREHQRKREQKRNEFRYGDFSGDSDKMTPTPKQIEWKRLRDEKEAQEAARKKPKGRPKKKAWEVWLENKDALDPKAGKMRPTDPEYKGKKPMGYGHIGGRTESGNLKPSKVETHMPFGFMMPPTKKPVDISDSIAGGQSHGEQSTRARERHRGRGERDQSMLLGNDQGYNESQGTALKDPKKFRSGHQPMDTWSSGIDTKYHHNPLSNPTKRGGGSLQTGSEPEDKMTRTIPKKVIPEKEVSILPKGGKSPKIKKSWEVWLDNITKPIPDSKGGRGSFQHCINANQDKRNPGGWCKQIERKIGKGLGALGEGKLNRKTGKPMKLKPRKITLDDFEYDDKPSYFKQVASEEKKKKEKKKAKNKRPPIKGISSYLQGPKKMEVTSPHGKGQQTGGKETGEGWQKYWDEHKDELLDYEKTQKKREAKEKKKGRPKHQHPCPYCGQHIGGGTLTRMLKPKEDKKEEPESDSKKADYFVEEIRSNIIYHNKVFPLIGMIAGQAARGMGKVGKKIGGELLEGASEVGQGMLQGVAEEEEE